uniref:ZU5 domain-containing protein n=1 Tax=Micrurus paraensis TaxID=1970185 RepID=A0A2D4KJ25_9SAUR
MSVSCHLKEFSWSKSEGSLVDLDDGSLTRNDWIDNKENGLHLKSHWTGEFKQDAPGGFKTNPFWKELSASNPFLDDIAESCNKEKNNRRVSILKEDPDLFFRESNENEAFQNQREAYKTAWLNQRQLARSCLDLNVINQGPGWAQTQSIETHIVCKVNCEGGSVQLPDSDIAVHFPEGHVALGEFQEVGLQAILDSPLSLNDEFSTTLTPLIKLTLSNLNTTEAILLEMKIAAEIKKDPFSQYQRT